MSLPSPSPSPSLAALELFTDVVRLGSFAAAAKARGVDPSSVSRQIASLETALGLHLFLRSTRRLDLTEAGQSYHARIVGLLGELEEARQQASDLVTTATGLLRVTASVAFGERWLMPRIAAFRRICPDLTLDLVLTDRNVDLVAEGVDLAIRHVARLEGTGTATKLMDTAYRVLASPELIARDGMPDDPGGLEERDCIKLSVLGQLASWTFRGIDAQDRTVPVDGTLSVTSPLALRRAALDGLGIALLADWIVDEDIAAGRLVDLFPGHDVAAGAFGMASWLVYPSRAYVPTKTRAMIGFLKDEAAKARGPSRA